MLVVERLPGLYTTPRLPHSESTASPTECLLGGHTSATGVVYGSLEPEAQHNQELGDESVVGFLAFHVG